MILKEGFKLEVFFLWLGLVVFGRGFQSGYLANGNNGVQQTGDVVLLFSLLSILRLLLNYTGKGTFIFSGIFRLLESEYVGTSSWIKYSTKKC